MLSSIQIYNDHEQKIQNALASFLKINVSKINLPETETMIWNRNKSNDGICQEFIIKKMKMWN